ncbi:Aste57867_21033 [Aphanomyces stellatus]|uniref:Choline transporter-like protein n=1 Tax=Aphanomyces stellatus TaxID=120398 RepID=A0A485LGG9_9STRA|nr:hypothetical protein As57867_020965 [Aphanomyces stellatus]VFT97708.1 Aste57867_21033 [Aphanomyces stellatus]
MMMKGEQRDTDVESTRSSDNGIYVVEKSAAAAPPAQRRCNDLVFLLAFLAVVIMTVVFAAQYGPELIKETQVTKGHGTTGFMKVLTYAAMFGGVSVGISLAWVLLMMVAGEFVIWASIVFMVACCVFAAIFMTKKLNERNAKLYWWPAPVFGLFALLIILYAVCIRKRVKFAAVHLKVAGSALFRLPMTLVVALVMVLVQVAWAITWFLGTYGLFNHLDILRPNSHCADPNTLNKCKVHVKYGPAFGLALPLLVVFFWGAMVVKNIVAVTVSGAVAAWKVNAATPLITLGAWGRAMTINLGSICFGSLVVAILEAIQTLLTTMSNILSQSGNCVAACIVGCLGCLVGCLKDMVETFNRFAYAYVGIHGYSFLRAGRQVSQLFHAKGWTGVVNDDLTQKVFWLGNLVVGGLSCFLAVVVVADQVEKKTFEFPGVKRPEYMVGLVAFFIGYIVNNLFMSLMGGAVTTIFVLWAEDPLGWSLTQPHHYSALSAAWLKIYPDEYNHGLGHQPLDGKADPVAKV